MLPSTPKALGPCSALNKQVGRGRGFFPPQEFWKISEKIVKRSLERQRVMEAEHLQVNHLISGYISSLPGYKLYLLNALGKLSKNEAVNNTGWT